MAAFLRQPFEQNYGGPMFWVAFQAVNMRCA